ncbi:ATP-binding protein [Streptomyces sp. NPDC028722]|uniref:ATP-binding protein n=1 Tax=unclassified Streptomyces TaxID=2593676 RepID=UPI0033F91F20
MTSNPLQPCRPDAHPPLSRRIHLGDHPIPGRPARAAVRQMIRCLGVSSSVRPGEQDNTDTAALVATELVTNAWRHAGGAMEMRLIWDGRALTVEVDDPSSTSPTVLAPHRRGPHGGYGLALVNSLVEAWGTYPRLTGKTVWARCVLVTRC